MIRQGFSPYCKRSCLLLIRQTDLHIVINDKGEVINYQITPGNCDDREPLKDGTFTKNLFGKLIADRGYISQNL